MAKRKAAAVPTAAQAAAVAIAVVTAALSAAVTAALTATVIVAERASDTQVAVATPAAATALHQ